MSLRYLALSILSLSCIACGSETNAEAPEDQQAPPEAWRDAREAEADVPAVAAADGEAFADADGYRGTLLLEENQPMEGTRIVRLDLETLAMAMEGDGFDGDSAAGRVVFIARCGDYGVGGQLTLVDEDGFSERIGPCLENSTLGGLQQSRISLDGRHVALYDGNIKVPMDGAGGDFGLTVDRGGVRVYDVEGNEKVTFLGVGSIAWGPDGHLYTVGLGESDTGEPFGVYRFSEDFQSIERVDDGRLENTLYSLQIRPDGEQAAFIYNNQIWTMDMQTGAPRRALAFDFPIGAITYAPDGSAIAFITKEPITEGSRRPGPGYYIHMLRRDGSVDSLNIPFIPGGPMRWLEN